MPSTTPRARVTPRRTPPTLKALQAEGIEVLGPMEPGFEEILTVDALRFVAGLQRAFGERRTRLLEDRRVRQERLDAGERPDFLKETRKIRAGEWQVAPLPEDLEDRRVEITGPVDRKMVINALNSGANCFMADLEDSHSPTWSGTIQGQINLRDAVNGVIEYTNPQTGKHYSLNPQVATLMVRPRGWHLHEKHVWIDGQPMSASLFDFGLYMFHNCQRLRARGTGPYFYLPKLETHREARLWNDVLVRAQEDLGLPPGTIRVTVLIETILAAFEMDEILFELRDHIAGLNCGRWDYIFSFIKRFRKDPNMVLPDRAQVTMTRHFMHSYSLLAIKTCHRRGALAIGGMAAQIPIRDDPHANQRAMDKVIADKQREANDGHDGTWVAHPGLVQVAREQFDAVMPTPNQMHRLREDVEVTAADLLDVPDGSITEEGLRLNIRVGVQYMEAWLGGNGCVPLYHLMEDAATAEISRTQIWQWLHNAKRLDDGRVIDVVLFNEMFDEEMARIAAEVGQHRYNTGHFTQAAQLFQRIILEEELVEFLTLRAYELLD